jgi:class 3 adenylate cyclase/predicted ATPase
MFCDMVGSSALSMRLDPEEQSDVVAAFHTCCAKEVASLGGMVAQYLGDGVLAYFGYPIAHENDAERAILAGLAILKSIGGLKAVGGIALQTRIGIGSGVVVVGDLIGQGVTQANAAIGATTNLVARLQAVAEPNSIVISPVTHRLVGALFDYRDLGQHTLKGFSEPVHVRQVLGVSRVESRFVARQSESIPLLGREEELELLLRRWGQVKRGGGRLVLLTGEPGIGKSRLACALQERLASEPHTVLSYYCSPYHQNSALHPIIGQMTRVAGIEREDSGATKLEKLQSLLTQSSEDLVADMPLFSALLSIPGGDRYPLPNDVPKRLKERTLHALLDHLKNLAAKQPVLMVFEDLQWIDPTSLELLCLSADQLAGQRMLLVATTRPDFSPPWPSHRHVSTIALSRLDKNEGKALVSGLTGGKTLPAEVLSQIVARTDGVPLFIEELTKTVLESGLLCESDDRYELRGPLPPLAIPSTLHASLVARLDRLASVKDVAQIGAAIGREFPYTLVAAVAAAPEHDLRSALAQLAGAELIFQRGVPPESTYQFKHALVQDVAYASLVRSRRQQLHGQIARALEKQFPEVVAAEPEILAHHLTEASIPEAAIGYWRAAGERALSRSGNAEAVKHLTRGVQLVQTLPASPVRDRKELTLSITLGSALMAVKGYAAPETEKVFSRARDLLGSSNDLSQQMMVLSGLSMACLGRSELSAALAITQEMLAVATRLGRITALTNANRCMGQTLWIMGSFDSARLHFERTLDLAADSDARGNPVSLGGGLGDDRAVALAGLARTLWIEGYVDQAVARAKDAVSCARALGMTSAVSLAISMFWQSVVAYYVADARSAGTHVDELLAHCAEHNFTDWEHQALFQRGAVVAKEGDLNRGVEIMRAAVAETERMGIYRTLHLAQLATAHMGLGDNETASSLLHEALERSEKTSERFLVAELNRLRGELLLRLRKDAEAEAALSTASMVAREQKARFWELRVATTLARHRQSEGRHTEACKLLQPVYRWFTEGLNTPDLKAAGALMSERKHASSVPLPIS